MREPRVREPQLRRHKPMIHPYYGSQAVMERPDPPILTFGPVVTATTLGTVTGYVELFDTNGNSAGFLPVYDEIT